MCTVSYYPYRNGYVMTSNRDEKISRKWSSQPVKKTSGDHTIWFPQDMDAMGTWFGSKSNGNTYILFNGAEQKHQTNPPYKKSRGIILLEMMENDSHSKYWNTAELDGVEPFSVVVAGRAFLHLHRWDGSKKKVEVLDMSQHHIWSSSTLYSPVVAAQRVEWFNHFVNENGEKKDPDSIFNFHLTEKMDDKENGLVINREGMMITKSITQSVFASGMLSLKHFDLMSNEVSQLIGEVI